MAQTNWKKVLNNIIYFHEEDTIMFQIQDVEELHAYIRNIESKNAKLEGANEQLAKNLDRAQCQLLTSAIKSIDTAQIKSEPLSKFKIYA